MPCQSVTANYSLVYAGTSNSVFGQDATDRILGFTSNIGLGSESSTLSFTLAGKAGTNAFGVSPEKNVGRAVIFTCNSFNFGGIIKSLSNSEDGGGNTTKVTLTCAKEMLANGDIMLNKNVVGFDSVRAWQSQYGTTFVRINIADVNGSNVHAITEGASVPASLRNENVSGTNAAARPRAGDCRKYGLSNQNRVAHGNSTYSAILNSLYGNGFKIKTVDGSDTLYVDFTPITNLANGIPYASTSAYKMSVLDLANSVCDEAGFDFHCTIEGQWIKFKLIDKRVETTFGSVQNIVNTAKNNDKCISSSIGAEFKGVKTARFITGHHINYIKEAYIGGNAKGALVGQIYNQKPLYSYHSDFRMMFDTSKLSQALSQNGFSGVGGTQSIQEREFIACGNLDTWKLWGIENPNSLSRSCLNACNLPVARARSFLRNQGSAHYVARSAVEAVKSLGIKSPGAMIYEEVCYSYFKNLYETYYGQYYLVVLNGGTTCFQDPTGYVGGTGIFLGEGGAATLMDTPIDSGWPDNERRVIGNTTLAPFFDNAGKLTCFVGIPMGDTLGKGLYNTTFDPTLMNAEYVVENGTLYTKAQVDGRAYNIGGELGILIKMPSIISHRPVLSGGINSFGLRAISLCLGRGLLGFSNSGGTLDTSYANIFKENVAAGRFTKIAIPMKNNQLVYGPWRGGAYGARNGGGVDIQVREDLNPWQYGSYGNMDYAGQNYASHGIPWRTRYESGHVTIAESPAESLGEKNVGEALLASVVVKFDKSGSTTTYNYETYKPKFGNAAENFNTFIKKNIADRRDNYNILKENYHEIIRNHNNAMRVAGQIRERLFRQQIENNAGANAHSQSQIMNLSYPDPFQGQDFDCKTEVGLTKAYDSSIFQDQDNYAKYAAVGLDMFFAPVSTAATFAMGYMSPKNLPDEPGNNSSPLSMPPFEGGMTPKKNLAIDNFRLNPFSTRANINSYFSGRGSSFGFQTDYCTYGAISQVLDLDNAKQDFNNVRAGALRGPLMLTSWGYDLDGKPVPGDGSDSFTTGWMSNPKSWPTGPIDLRWDERRGVWTIPAGEKIVAAQLIQPLSAGGSAKAILIGGYGEDVPSSQGPLGCQQLSGGGGGSYGMITVYDVVNRPCNIGTRVTAVHSGEGKYLPLGYIDTYKKKEFDGCGDTVPVTDGCTQLGLWGMPKKYTVQGLDEQANPVLHDLEEIFKYPDLPEQSTGEDMVLGFSKTNEMGQPCMKAFPIVNCSGTYPDDDGSGPTTPLPCPPGYIRSPTGSGRCVRTDV